MNPIEALDVRVRREIPAVEISMDPPMRTNGIWTLDVVWRKRHVAVEWNPQRKEFGISRISGSRSGLGEKPEEVYLTEDRVVRRLKELLEND